MALEDRAASQILGFIVGLAVVTSSLAIATYFITTVPNDSPSEENQQLQGDVQRAIDVLAATPGEPRDWHEDYQDEDLRRVGLLWDGNSHWVDREKIELIQDGTLAGSRILDSWDLDASERAFRVEGKVQSVPIGEVPELETYGVAHADALPQDYAWAFHQESREAAELFAEVSPAYDYQEHFWRLGKTTHPATGLGNTVPDHAYFIETQLFPKMAGIEATYSTADTGATPWGDAAAAEQAFDDYTPTGMGMGNPQSATRWHVVADGDPHGLPSSQEANDEHVLTVNWRFNPGQDDKDDHDAEGVGLWRVQAGASSFALLGAIDASGASAATLSFDHLLKVDTSTDPDICSGPSDDDCMWIRPSIAFWNTTGTAEWTRLQNNPSDCAASSVWDDWGDAEATSGWGDASVDLCEALEHSDDTLWLGLYWDTGCLDGDGSAVKCEHDEADTAVHGWFVDNLEVSGGGSTLYETDFEPPTDENQHLFVSNGVDHNRTYDPAPDHAEENAIAYLRHEVQNGTNVVALAPDDPTPGDSTPGEWLSQLGLTGVETTPDDEVTTEEADNILLQFPHELPERSTDYRRENVTWQTGQPSTPNSWELPPNFQELTPVQTGKDDQATAIVGKPYPDGGGVAAIAYNYTHFQNETLREELYENLYKSSVLIDPSFEVGDELPDPGTSHVASDRRVVIVSVTEDDRYVVPLEITMWMWDRG